MKNMNISNNSKINQCDQVDDMMNDPDKLFKAGLLLLKENNVWDAWYVFKKAHQLRPTDSKYLSYFGLCTAKVEKNATKAISLCEKAVEKEFFRAELFCNLGKVYLIKGDRMKAYMAFKQGLSIDKKNIELQNELKKMGIRKQPVFSFLSRNNIVNHLAGFLRYKLRTKGGSNN